MLHSRFVVPGTHRVAHAAFSDRWGGYSVPPYNSLNLGRGVGDDDSAVTANRNMLAQVLGLQADRLSFTSQVHGTAVHTVDLDDLNSSVSLDTVEADAQVTSSTLLGLAVLVADCTPVLLADPDAGVIASVHAGRKGMAAGVVGAAVESMRERGADNIAAIIGPSISPRRYEVPVELREEIAEIEPVAASVSAEGTPAIDVAAGVAEQLRREGVRLERWVSACTYDSPDLFSYRRDAVTGRFAGVIWMEPTAQPR